jgi:hypothetical protein
MPTLLQQNPRLAPSTLRRGMERNEVIYLIARVWENEQGQLTFLSGLVLIDMSGKRAHLAAKCTDVGVLGHRRRVKSDIVCTLRVLVVMDHTRDLS